MRRLALLFVLGACSTVQLNGESVGPKELTEIAELEDRRSLGDGRLVLLALTANEPEVRARGLLALGRLQAPETVEAIVKGLTDPDPGARLEAAFGIGLFGLSWQPLTDEKRLQLGQALAAAEPDEDDARVRFALIDAMGRVASAESLNRLVALLAADDEAKARAAVALGVSCKAVKAQLPMGSVSLLAALVKPPSVRSVRFGAAYALAMSKNLEARPALAECARDEASEVRAVCVRGLAEVGISGDVPGLKTLLDDPDYRVAVEATRALAKLSLKCKPGECSASNALEDLAPRVDRLLQGDSVGGAQPLLALAQAGLPAGSPVLVTLRRQLADGAVSVTSPSIRADVANIDCRLAAAVDRQNGTLVESLDCGFGVVTDARRLSVGLLELANSPAVDADARVNAVSRYLTHPSPKVQLAALEVVAQLKSGLVIETVRALVGHDDLVVAATAAATSAVLEDREAIPAIRLLAKRVTANEAATVAAALAQLNAKEAAPDLESWLTSPYLHVRLAAGEALTTLTGGPVVAPRYEGAAPRRPKSTADGETKLRVRTAKGDFEITLDLAQAPRTAANAITLAKKGFFNNLTFHRVVPDFVAQGGDPRGDGEGGPGYAIRCEINRHVYARSAVGMALSGKDTGGSQFFVTTSAQPHLDGKYTVFGDVTEGSEVIDALLEGDAILEVSAH